MWIVARWQRILQDAYMDCQMSRRECTSILMTSWKRSVSSWIENCLKSDQKDIRCRWIIPSKRSRWNHREKPVYSHKYSCKKKSLWCCRDQKNWILTTCNLMIIYKYYFYLCSFEVLEAYCKMSLKITLWMSWQNGRDELPTSLHSYWYEI